MKKSRKQFSSMTKYPISSQIESEWVQCWNRQRKSNSKTTKIPKFNKKILDITQLSFEVCRRGGFHNIKNVHGAFFDIFKMLSNYDIKSTNPSVRLKRYYIQLGLKQMEAFTMRAIGANRSLSDKSFTEHSAFGAEKREEASSSISLFPFSEKDPFLFFLCQPPSLENKDLLSSIWVQSPVLENDDMLSSSLCQSPSLENKDLLSSSWVQSPVLENDDMLSSSLCQSPSLENKDLLSSSWVQSNSPPIT